jgi:hypothetical protein
MRESCMYGSERGARGNSRPYRTRREMRPACKLILNREPVEAITRQLSLALFMDAKLDLGRKRARAKAPA